jgi:hypothetical protein
LEEALEEAAARGSSGGSIEGSVGGSSRGIIGGSSLQSKCFRKKRSSRASVVMRKETAADNGGLAAGQAGASSRESSKCIL